ncbi:hypothetical protein, partial [Streptomyces albogriseolus]|uniref:hypothetical protein n=1 Tax=Streptomyces albogriseolus TaxID=1887 RepID=UPI003CEF7D02
MQRAQDAGPRARRVARVVVSGPRSGTAAQRERPSVLGSGRARSGMQRAQDAGPRARRVARVVVSGP